MNRLPGRIQVRIVVQLAIFASPSEVARSVKEEFGLDVSRQQVERYNPERVAGERLRPSLRRVFYALRADAATNLDAIPLAHRPYRLKRLGEMAKRSEERATSFLRQSYWRSPQRMLGVYMRTNEALIYALRAGPELDWR